MNRMRELRIEKGISMKEAASALEIPYTTYVNYEKGLREPNSEMLIRISDIFDTSIDYLLCRDGTARTEEVAILNPRKKKMEEMQRQVDEYRARLHRKQQEQKEKAPVLQESPEETEARAIRLYDALIAGGWVKEGEDITDDQLEFLDGLSRMLDAFFNRRN